MSALEEAAKLLPSLSRSWKAQLLLWVVQDIGDAFPGIESREGVCGGEPCVVRTRIPIWALEAARRQGVSEADILRSYPMLRAEDLGHAWSFVRAHRAEIEARMRENESA